ncbi:DUF1501 domain-containing protein [Gimesia fumaroli]|uniref:DUF1501 domain-containing protein n=1 Tax=Gimesia fumaroli TaxID=2527976 RepID=A0A518I4U0_9PLAN|nr:DUF1501 domain-containing protein [Gimesia fumaroli]QDV48048.1 hypothetical protein Enr17x_00570 [Gimesia fumaroli]
MLSFCEHNGLSGRREFLRVGGLALGGLTLPGLLSAKAQAAGSGKLLKNKSVIFLFMHGGPSQIETFDPKMDAPAGIRSATGEVTTRIPGVTFGGTFQKLAPLADRMSIVRSYRTGDSRHDIKPIVHKDTLDANLGSLYSRVVGSNHPENGMPTNAVLFPQAIDDKMMPAITKFGKFDSHGLMGSAYAPFVPGAGGDMQSNMTLSIPQNRLDDRRLLLSNLDRARWAADKSETFAASSHLQQQAFDVILGGVSEAFDLSKEDPNVVARYDTAPLVKPEQISTRWKNYKRYIDNAQSLGKLLLMARRLCEAGCGFVTITTNFVWDMHADKNNAGVEEGMDYMGVPFDHAVSAFMEDVRDRGLSDDILLVCSGEMGRTPKMNTRGGRDHWGNLSPLMLTGGGLNMGQVIGQSTRHASEPQTEPIERKDLVTSIMHTLFDLGELRITRGVPNEIVQVATAGNIIPGLF